MSVIVDCDYNKRLYLGYGTEDQVSKCLGKSINRYNDPIAKSMTRLFGRSLYINVGGHKYCVNKKSFKNHLQSIGFDNKCMGEVNKLGYTVFIQRNAKALIVSEERFGSFLPHSNRVRLFQDMVEQISVNNTEAAKNLIHRGAYVDREFFKLPKGYQKQNCIIDTVSGRAFDPMTRKTIVGPIYETHFYSRAVIETILAEHYVKTNYFSYTPLSLAVEKENQSLAKLIMNAKGDEISLDKIQTIRFKLLRRSGKFNWTSATRKVQQVVLKDDGKIALEKR